MHFFLYTVCIRFVLKDIQTCSQGICVAHFLCVCLYEYGDCTIMAKQYKCIGVRHVNKILNIRKVIYQTWKWLGAQFGLLFLAFSKVRSTQTCLRSMWLQRHWYKDRLKGVYEEKLCACEHIWTNYQMPSFQVFDV